MSADGGGRSSSAQSGSAHAMTADIAGLAQKAVRRTHQPIRRKSQPKEAGESYFRPLSKAQVIMIWRALSDWAEAMPRQKGKRWGPLTPIDIEVFRALLFKLMTWSTGKLEWAYVEIARIVKRSKQTVSESLARLRVHGFLDWIRRFERTDVEGRGPQIKQATNAYRIGLPDKVRAWMEQRRKAKAGPPPDDHEIARAARAAEIRAMEIFATADASPAIAAADAKAARSLE